MEPNQKETVFIKYNTITKDKALEAVKEMPQEFDLEKLIERLIFIDKVEKEMKQLDEGQTKSHDEVKKAVKSWQK